MPRRKINNQWRNTTLNTVNPIAGEDLEVKSQDPPVELKRFSWKWWKNLFSAINLFGYSPREHLIYQVSSYTTHLQWLVGTWVVKSWTTIIFPTLKSAVTKGVTLLTAIFHAS